MIMRRHPYSADWAIFSRHCIPTALVTIINSTLGMGTKKYFISKNIGSGLVLDSGHSSFLVAQTRFLTVVNDSDNDDYLGGAGRTLLLPHNITTQKIENGISVPR